MKLYVGNLPYDITEEELTTEFSKHGQVDSVSVPFDRDAGKPRGFAFVEMPSKSEAIAAITAINGSTIKERTVVVNESRPRNDSRPGGGSGNRPGGGYRSGGFGGNRSSGGRPGGGDRRRF